MTRCKDIPLIKIAAFYNEFEMEIEIGIPECMNLLLNEGIRESHFPNILKGTEEANI